MLNTAQRTPTETAVPYFTWDGEVTDEMKTSYIKNGVLIVEGFASSETCESLINAANNIIRNESYGGDPSNSVFRPGNKLCTDYLLDSVNDYRCFLEPSAIGEDGNLVDPLAVNKIGHNLHDAEPTYRKFSQSQNMETVMRELGYAEFEIAHSMHILKHPKKGTEVTWHCDQTFLTTDGQDPQVTGFWVAFEGATLENGCLWVIPGSHHTPPETTYGMRDGVMDYAPKLEDTPEQNDTGKVALPVKAGTLVVLHGLLRHMSLPNHSDKSRHAYTIHITDKAATPSPINWWVQGRGEV